MMPEREEFDLSACFHAVFSYNLWIFFKPWLKTVYYLQSKECLTLKPHFFRQISCFCRQLSLSMIGTVKFSLVETHLRQASL